MYAKFYQLRRIPFHITPDPEFLFLSPSHKQALATIIYGVRARKGFLTITGDVGLGKTTIVRSYLEQADREQLKVAYIFNSNVSFESLLKAICRELDIDVEPGDPFETAQRFHKFLIEEYRHGGNVGVIIDDAQNMPVDTLLKLRMLSNLETSKDKLVQIILVGQPELERLLGLEELRQIKGRIALRAAIVALTRSQSLAYVRHRLEKCSSGDIPIFTNGALMRIVKKAGGNPRLINILCDNALIAGLGYQVKPVNSKIVREVIRDFDGRRKPAILSWKAAAFSAVLFVAAVVWAGFHTEPLLSGTRGAFDLLRSIQSQYMSEHGVKPAASAQPDARVESVQSETPFLAKVPKAPARNPYEPAHPTENEGTSRSKGTSRSIIVESIPEMEKSSTVEFTSPAWELPAASDERMKLLASLQKEGTGELGYRPEGMDGGDSGYHGLPSEAEGKPSEHPVEPPAAHEDDRDLAEMEKPDPPGVLADTSGPPQTASTETRGPKLARGKQSVQEVESPLEAGAAERHAQSVRQAVDIQMPAAGPPAHGRDITAPVSPPLGPDSSLIPDPAESQTNGEDATAVLDYETFETIRQLAIAIPGFGELSAVRQRALIRMAHDVSTKQFLKCRDVIDAINEEDFDRAADAMLKTRWSKGTKNRVKIYSSMMREDSE